MTQMNDPVVWEALSRRLKRILKAVPFRIGTSPGNAQPIFVMGYGRSGTTMLLDVFEHDMRVEVLGENDPRIARDHMLVRERVGTVISASRAPVIVMKPILDSFSVSELMREHPTARVIWAFRAYEPVVASALKKFGTSVADELREVVVNDRGNGWLKRGLPAATLARLRTLEVDRLGPNEWMALVWWSVNLTLLRPDLESSDRFLLVRYEDLIRDPERWMRGIYDFIGLPYRHNAIEWIDSNAVDRKVDIKLNNQVRELCEALAAQIDATFKSTSSSGAERRFK